MKRLFFLALICFGLTTMNAGSRECVLPQKTATTPVWMTIFIHGAIGAEWIFNSLISVFQDSLDGSTYQKAVSLVRNDPLFFKFQAIQKPGLQKIELSKGASELDASAVALMYDQITALTQKSPTINYYYTFGWSGLVSTTKRLEDAEQLHEELVREVKNISEHHHITPQVRIIAYSHGGNVSLNLAKTKQRDLCLRIDELILIGSPVQRETDYLVADPMFKKVYNFYSPDDMIQPSDFFSSRVSTRIFKEHRNFSLPKNLQQICVKVANYTPRDPSKRKNKLPTLATNYDKKQVRRSFMNPGHIELWHMGWTPTMYRQNFPLHPLPIVDFTSFITAQVSSDPTLGNDLIVSIHPAREIMKVSNRHSNTRKIFPFVPQQMLATLADLAQTYKPSEEFLRETQRRLSEAVALAHTCKHAGVVKVEKSDGSYYKVSKKAMCLH